jgi:hypothetical protein
MGVRDAGRQDTRAEESRGPLQTSLRVLGLAEDSGIGLLKVPIILIVVGAIPLAAPRGSIVFYVGAVLWLLGAVLAVLGWCRLMLLRAKSA